MKSSQTSVKFDLCMRFILPLFRFMLSLKLLSAELSAMYEWAWQSGRSQPVEGLVFLGNKPRMLWSESDSGPESHWDGV